MTRSIPGYLAARAFAGILLALAVSCGAASHIRTAQDLFSQGAALESQAKLAGLLRAMPGDPTPSSPLIAAEGAKSYYARALAKLEQISAGEVEQLRADKLLTTKRTLEALCHWRLGHLDAARQIAQELAGTAAVAETPRDRVLLLALPGLIKNDRAYRMIPAERQDDAATWQIVRDELIHPEFGALADLAAARAHARGRPLESWVIQAQLAVWKNYLDARSRLGPVPLALAPEQIAEVRALLEDLERAAARGLGAARAAGLRSAWSLQLGVLAGGGR